jgi:hypothetical protein
MANMTAVTQQYGPSTSAFLIVPLVSAFFLDLVNALLIPAFVGRLWRRLLMNTQECQMNATLLFVLH